MVRARGGVGVGWEFKSELGVGVPRGGTVGAVESGIWLVVEPLIRRSGVALAGFEGL